MIWESAPWKIDVAKRVGRVRRRSHQRRSTESSLLRIEQDVFNIAYSIRKLLEAKKMSDEAETVTIAAVEYPLRDGTLPDVLNWQKLEELYDLDAPSTAAMTLRELCNQLIHSFVSIRDMGVNAGFFVASDRARKRSVFRVRMNAFCDVASVIAEDAVVSLRLQRDEKSGEMKLAWKPSAEPTTNELFPKWK